MSTVAKSGPTSRFYHVTFCIGGDDDSTGLRTPNPCPNLFEYDITITILYPNRP